MSDPRDDEPFAQGDGTLLQLRQQSFDPDDLGTRIQTPVNTVAMEVPAEVTAPAPSLEPSDDPLARIERQLAEIAHVVHGLQRRLDSIDGALARFLAR
jgi:hypothetical protein